MRVVYIPGILGSNLGVVAANPPLYRPVWVNPALLVAGGVRYLQLAPDGVGPGPLAGGLAVEASGIFAPVYGPLAYFMSQVGWNVLALGWDWRTSLLTAARVAWPAIREWSGGEPVTIVAHSLGGLLARAIYGQMLEAGADAQLRRIITLGTPHYGSFEAVRVLHRLPTLYQGLVQLAGWTQWIAGTPGPAVLDAAIGSMPSWYELLPFRASGPLFDAAPDQAALLYTPAFYRDGNPFVQANLLQSAELVQGELDAWLPAGRVYSIAGTGYETSYLLDVAHSASSEDGYQSTDLGDGTVTVAEASPPGVPVFTATADHALMLLSPIVTGLVYTLVRA